MENAAMKVFENEQFGKVRVVSKGGEPWFVVADVCKAIELPDTHKAVGRLDGDEKGRNLILTLGGKQEMTVVNESGLYALVLGSRKPEAKTFKRWITHEVIPSIRRYGVYAVDEVLNNPDMLIGALQALKEERAEKERLLQINSHQAVQIEALHPKADYCDKVLQAPDTMPMTPIVKEYGMTAYQMNKMLSDMKVQYKTGGTWALYREYQGEGYTKMRTSYDCYGHARNQMQWTQKGRKFLHMLMQKKKNDGLISKPRVI